MQKTDIRFNRKPGHVVELVDDINKTALCSEAVKDVQDDSAGRCIDRQEGEKTSYDQRFTLLKEASLRSQLGCKTARKCGFGHALCSIMIPPYLVR